MSSKHPEWMTKKAPSLSIVAEMRTLIDGLSLHTVCQRALCPNVGECFSHQTATFLIMGDICTRSCSFCAIRKGRCLPLDPDEPWNVAQAVSKLELHHVVITSVTRDDLPDGGGEHFARTVNAVRHSNPMTTIEVLVPDFDGSDDALETVVACSPEVIGHNMETIPRLYAEVRPKADPRRSLNLLQTVKSMDMSILTKSGLMLGLGEERGEVIKSMEALRTAECDFLTIGQYLAPSSENHPVIRYVPPHEFEEYKNLGQKMGFAYVASGPFVRSSFKAAEMVASLRQPHTRSASRDDVAHEGYHVLS